MKWRGIWAIVRKDLKIIVRSKNTVLPLIFVPIVLMVVVPAIVVLIASNSSTIADFQSDMSLFYANMPEGIRSEMAQFETGAQQIIYLTAAFVFAPMFLIVPLMVTSIVGADSIAGEQERKTIEGLLYAPISDLELYTAKLLTAWIPAILVSLIGGVAYSVVINLAAWNIMGRVFMPTLGWVVQVVWLAPAAAGLGLAAMVLVSSRVKTVQEASQTGGLVVIPIILLLMSQFAGLIYFSVDVVLLIGAGVWGIDLVLLLIGARLFRRGELIAKL